jgi:hypothetical protein
MKFCLIYHIIRPILVKFGAGDVHDSLLSDSEFCENSLEKAIPGA